MRHASSLATSRDPIPPTRPLYFLNMPAAGPSVSSEDVRSRSQQPILASQRTKAEAHSTPTEANRQARFAAFFPLGYKAAVSQWVSRAAPQQSDESTDVW